MRPTPVSIGDLNQRIIVYTQTSSGVDDYNMPILTTGTGVNRWASVKVKPNSYEIEGSNATEYHDLYEIKVRANLTITQGDRVDFGNVTLQVVGVDYSDKNYYIIKAIGTNVSLV